MLQSLVGSVHAGPLLCSPPASPLHPCLPAAPSRCLTPGSSAPTLLTAGSFLPLAALGSSKNQGKRDLNSLSLPLRPDLITGSRQLLQSPLSLCESPRFINHQVSPGEKVFHEASNRRFAVSGWTLKPSSSLSCCHSSSAAGMLRSPEMLCLPF